MEEIFFTAYAKNLASRIHMLIIGGTSSPESLKRDFVPIVIYEEIAGPSLSIGDEIIADGASFFAGNVKDKLAKSCIPEPESDSDIFELYND